MPSFRFAFGRAALVRRHCSAEQPIPQAVFARLLIDTGAQQTCLDDRLVNLLGLSATGIVPIHTPSTGVDAADFLSYDIELFIEGHDSATHIFPALEVLGCDFAGQGIDGLAGSDMLARSRFTYSGPDGMFWLSF